MISEQHFIKTQNKCFCQTPELIENYEQAINDETQIWVCHHRDEIRVLPSGMIAIRSAEELIENGRYYNCPANELIFLTASDHTKIHSNFIPHPKASIETKQKMSKARKGRKLTDEHKKNLSKALKGKESKLKNIYRTEFGRKYFEKYGYSRAVNIGQYDKERHFYKYHGYLSWEKEA
jgi:hypothetical protein